MLLADHYLWVVEEDLHLLVVDHNLDEEANPAFEAEGTKMVDKVHCLHNLLVYYVVVVVDIHHKSSWVGNHQAAYLDERGVFHPLNLEVALHVQEVLVAQVEAQKGNCCILQVQEVLVDRRHNDRQKRCCYCLNTNPSSLVTLVKEPVEAVMALWPFSLSELQPEQEWVLDRCHLDRSSIRKAKDFCHNAF